MYEWKRFDLLAGQNRNVQVQGRKKDEAQRKKKRFKRKWRFQAKTGSSRRAEVEQRPPVSVPEVREDGKIIFKAVKKTEIRGVTEWA